MKQGWLLMERNVNRKKYLVFFGAGYVGEKVCRYCETIGVKPDYFCDSDRQKWGGELLGIPVISPGELQKMVSYVEVVITCMEYSEILCNITKMGVHKDNIYCGEDVVWRINRNLYQMLQHETRMNDNGENYDCILDLSCGMVLGGVENWVYTFGNYIAGLGIAGAYIVPLAREHTVENRALRRILVDEKENPVDENMKCLIAADPKVIICNFPFAFWKAACCYKKHLNKNVKIIAIIHNDEDIYYQEYCKYRESIDICMTISSRMDEKIQNYGLKSRRLLWEISPVAKQHVYSLADEKIRIGYAGRIVRTAKRLDLFLLIAEKLRGESIRFCISIAGSGEYEEELKKEIELRNLQDMFYLPGYIAHEEISEFWLSQDIYLSCSEWEGHSITQCEAMASGAVPIVTNTSGTEDDIKNGVNGYIVNVGDMDAIVDRIRYFYRNRDQLCVFGDNARESCKRNEEKYKEQQEFWKQLLLS